MRTICDLEGVAFLRQCNKIRHIADEVLKDTKVLEIRKNKPVFTGKETEDEQKQMISEQINKNINQMLDVLLEEKPDQTIRLFRAFIILDEGEKEPSGMDMLLTAMDIISDNRVIDFLSSLVRLGQMNTGG